MSVVIIESREVLGGAYPRHRQRGPFLRHAVELNEAGDVLRVFCKRVDIANLADRYAADPHAEPTCKSCLSALRKVAR